jgi:translocation and assembly module TamA
MRSRVYCLLFLWLCSCAHGSKRLCNNIVLQDGSLSLSKNEEILVCGTEDGNSAWKEVPLPQAQFQLAVFLQNEGYLSPRFERNKDQLSVWLGPRSTISSLEIEGASGLLDASKKRKIIGEPLIPSKLDEVQQWADTKLRRSGFACPQVQVKGQAWNRKLVLTVEPSFLQEISSFERAGLDGIDEESLARYEAFEVGDTYDVMETQLTVSRMLADGLIQSANFFTTCNKNEVSLLLRGSIGPPHAVRFEVGASTEEFPFASLTFKNARVDEYASSFTTVLYASPRTQSLTLSSQLYWLPWTKKNFFGPRARVARVSESAFEFIEAKAGMDIGRFWDMGDIRWVGRFGPTLNYVKTAQGLGPEDVSYLSLEGSLLAMSHSYESSLRNQYEGWDASFRYRGQKEGLGSRIDVSRYDFSYKILWNMGQYAPPLFVLGVRFDINAVDTGSVSAGVATNDILPIDYRIFYGGAENLRGFARKTLTNGDLGYLTAVYTGIELRLVEQLPWNIQPLLLLDVAQLGADKMKLDDPVFTSKGLGLRWASPFGTLRGSAARGRIYNEDFTTTGYVQDWVYFLSFGQEF